MPRFWLIYNLTLLLFLFAKSTTTASRVTDILLPLSLAPLLYLIAKDLKKINRRLPHKLKANTFATSIPQIDESSNNTHDALEGEIMPSTGISDTDRRLFLKLIGSTGLSIFFMAVFGKKSAQAAFFGSVPGPGTVSVKNIAGDAIDPAEAQPTDGYTITQIDDSTTPAYYGFVHKTGSWYITKEDSSGNYRYAKGASSFSTSWTSRASLTYDYFDAVF